jgi:zinc protease
MSTFTVYCHGTGFNSIKGTEKNGPEVYSRIIARNGGNENAFTADDSTTYFATLASDRIQAELELEAEA